MKLKVGLVSFLLMITFPLQAVVGYNVGNTAPDFSLKALDGKTYSLTSLRKKGHVLLVFWAVECVYCFAHIKQFNQVHEDFKDKLTVAAINVAGEYKSEVTEYVNDNGLKYLVLSERLKNLDVSESYRVLGTPTLVLVSPQGKVEFYGHQMPKLENWIK